MVSVRLRRRRARRTVCFRSTGAIFDQIVLRTTGHRSRVRNRYRFSDGSNRIPFALQPETVMRFCGRVFAITSQVGSVERVSAQHMVHGLSDSVQVFLLARQFMRGGHLHAIAQHKRADGTPRIGERTRTHTTAWTAGLWFNRRQVTLVVQGIQRRICVVFQAVFQLRFLRTG